MPKLNIIPKIYTQVLYLIVMPKFNTFVWHLRVIPKSDI